MKHPQFWARFGAVTGWLFAAGSFFFLLSNELDCRGRHKALLNAVVPPPPFIQQYPVDQVFPASPVYEPPPEQIVNKWPHRPIFKERPTWIEVANDGISETVILRADFNVAETITTPEREVESGLGRGMPIYVTFSSRDFKSPDTYSKQFRPGLLVAGNQSTPAAISVVDRTHVGMTYRGTMTLFCGNGRKHVFEGVEVDVLGSAPKQ